MSGSNPIDRITESAVRRLASATSRRGFLGRLGLAAAAAPVLPLLPVARAQTTGPRTEFERSAQIKDDRACTYWRYCAIDGSLCTCCGGGIHTCPPGTRPSPTSWVGSCWNPDDNRTYLISYNDCCGKASCNQCLCDGSDRETPVYRPQGNNDILWCFGLPAMNYHCTVAAVVGEA
jgi:methylamine dehydrogenase light chain